MRMGGNGGLVSLLVVMNGLGDTAQAIFGSSGSSLWDGGELKVQILFKESIPNVSGTIFKLLLWIRRNYTFATKTEHHHKTLLAGSVNIFRTGPFSNLPVFPKSRNLTAAQS